MWRVSWKTTKQGNRGPADYTEHRHFEDEEQARRFFAYLCARGHPDEARCVDVSKGA